MKFEIHKADSRGHIEHGWLNAHHSFSFGSYHNPERMHFGRLRVLNDDQIQGGGGFGTHPHDNMEIVTIMLAGTLRHKDSMGNSFVIRAGEVQRMSAGSGITHSEVNDSSSEQINLLQIWVLPKYKDIQPSYEQHSYSADQRNNKWQWLVRPDAADGACLINQDAYFARTDLSAGKDLNYQVQGPGNGIYIFIISGEINVSDTKIGKRDAMAVRDSTQVLIEASENSEILVIEVPLI